MNIRGQEKAILFCYLEIAVNNAVLILYLTTTVYQLGQWDCFWTNTFIQQGYIDQKWQSRHL